MEIKSTDKESFELIYKSCYGQLIKICYNVTYNLDIAQELVQEAFERFFAKNLTFKNEEEAKYWLIRVSKNLALNHLRRGRRDTGLIERMASSSPDVTGTHTVDAQKELDGKETVREVRNALKALPDNLRQVMILKEYGEMDYKSIGKVLGISETNVKVRVFRARKKLIEALDLEDGYVYR